MLNGFNSLMDPAQLGQSVQNAFLQGRDMRQQMETQRAYGEYARNMNAENAARVAQHDPRGGIQLQTFELKRQEAEADRAAQAQKADLQRRAAAGDKGALAELSGIDLNAWNTLNNADRAAIKQNIDYIGQAALAVSQLPEPQRAPAWDAYVQQGVQRGMTDLAQYVGQYSPDALNSVLAQAGQIKTFLDMSEPDYRVVPEGSALVNVSDPSAVAAYSGGSGQPQQQKPVQNGTGPNEVEARKLIRTVATRGYATPEELQKIAAGANLGPNADAAMQGWLANSGLKIGRDIGGTVYYLVNGKWYDNPEGR